MEARKLNYAEVVDTIVYSLSEYLRVNNIKSMVLGISGGLDSTVTAALCKIVSTQTGIPLIGISLPTWSNKSIETSSAIICGSEFCDKFSERWLESIAIEMNGFVTTCDDGQMSTPLQYGNVKARLRMTVLYYIASRNNGIVIDTDNLTEHYLGFFTRHGDEGDLNPIGGLWKHEVYELAAYLLENVYKGSEALKRAIEITPTDGNGVKDGGDMAQIAEGCVYEEVDMVLLAYLSNDSKKLDELSETIGKDKVDGIIDRHKRSSFKRFYAPLVIRLEDGRIMDKYAEKVIL